MTLKMLLRRILPNNYLIKDHFAFLLDKIIIKQFRKSKHYLENIFRGLCHICLTSLEVGWELEGFSIAEKTEV